MVHSGSLRLLQYAHGDAVDMRGLLESIPVRLTSVREYARTVLEPDKRAPADAPTPAPRA